MKKQSKNLELPRMIYRYADSALIKALLSNPKLGVSSFTYKLNDFDVTLYFVPCDYLPFWSSRLWIFSNIKKFLRVILCVGRPAL